MALEPIGTGAGVDVGPVQRISARDFPSPRIIRSEDAMMDDAQLSLYGIYPNASNSPGWSNNIQDNVPYYPTRNAK